MISKRTKMIGDVSLRLATLVLLLAGLGSADAHAQAWSVAQSYPVDGVHISRVVVGSISGPHGGDVVVVADSKVLIYDGDRAGNLAVASSPTQIEASDAAVGAFSGKSTAADLIVLGSLDGGPSGLYLLVNGGTGVLSAPIAIPGPADLVMDNSCRLVSADLNNDAFADVILTCGSAPTVAYLGVNGGAGTFAFSATTVVEQGRTVSEISSGDLDGNGVRDLLVKSVSNVDQGSVREDVLLGKKDGGYHLSRQWSVDTRSTLEDFDGDTLADQVVNAGGAILLSRNVGGGQFGTALSVAADDGCNIDSYAVGHLQTSPTDRHGRSKAGDLVLSESCGSVHELSIRLNNAGTFIKMNATPAFKEARYKMRVTITVASFSGSLQPTGNVLVVVGTKGKVQTLPLVNGVVTIPLQLQYGRTWISIGYVGDGTAAASTGLGTIYLPHLEGKYPDPSASISPSLFRQRRGAPAQFQSAVLNEANKPHMLLVTGVANNAGLSTPYLATDTAGATGTDTNGNALTYPLSGNPVVGTTYVVEVLAEDVYISDGYGDEMGLAVYDGSYRVAFTLNGASIGTYSPNIQMNSNGQDYVDDCECDVQTNVETDYFDSAITFTTPGSNTVTATGGPAFSEEVIVSNGMGGQDEVDYLAGTGYSSAVITATGKMTPTLSVSCSPNPITYGTQTTSCTSSISGGDAPSGTETWTIDGGAWISTGVNGSGGGFNGYAAGAHTIAVSYGGDANNNAVSGSTTLTINKATPTISVSCSVSQFSYTTAGAPATCSASVGGGATGTVAWTINGSPWTSTPLTGSVSFGDGNAAGAYTIGAIYSGDSNNNAVSASKAETINKVTPTVSLSCSPNPITYGAQSSTCTATLSGGSGSYSGSLSTTWDGNAWGSVNGSSSISELGWNTVAAGSHTFAASYAGDSNNNAVSSSTTLTINAMTPTVVATLASPSIVQGQTADTVSVQVGCNSACGSADYRIDGGDWGTVTLNASGSYADGTVPAGLSVGTHTIQINYLGNGNYNAASSNTLTLTVVSAVAPTVSAITSSLNPSTYGQGVTFTALVNTGGNSPSGSVNFYQGGTSIGTGTVSPVSNTNLLPYSSTYGAWGGDGEMITPNAVLAPDGTQTATQVTVGSGGQYYISQFFPCQAGPNTYSAWMEQTSNPAYQSWMSIRYFDGSGNLLAWISSATAIPTTTWNRFSGTTIGPAGTDSCVVTLEQQGNGGGGPAPGQGVYYWGAQVEQGSRPGPYIATLGTAVSGYGGIATFESSTLPVGTNSMTAVYAGDSNNLGSTSQNLSQVVTAATPTLAATCSPNPVVYGGTYTCTATLSGGDNPTGTVTWPGSIWGNTTALSGGTSSTGVLAATVSPGTYSGTMTYNGDGNNAPVSATVSITVTKATPTITWATPASIASGVALSGTQLDASASVGGSFAYSPVAGTVLTAGAQPLSVVFTPSDATDYTTASATVTLTVNKLTPTITVSCAPNPVTYLVNTTCTATVSAGATGTIAFFDGAVNWTTVALAGGAASAAGFSGHVPGTYEVNVTYSGDSTYSGASASKTLTIIKATPTITWAAPVAFAYGTPLSTTQLNATASVGGIFTYEPAAGVVPGVGAQTLSVLFTPSDAQDYTTATDSVPLAVAKVNAGMSVVSTVNPSIYGETIAVTVTMTGAGIAPSGSVTVTDGETNLGTLPLTTLGAASTATLTTSTLGAGTHNFSVSYSGDSNYN